MERLQRKTLVTKRLLKYTYYATPASESTDNRPALFFIHGFPDSAHLWSGVVAALKDFPNKIIVPDCLGYGGTDKPVETNLYAFKDQVEDLAEVLSNENAKLSVIIGHDWGSAIAQRMFLHKRDLFTGVVLLNTGYMVPSNEPFNLDAINAYTEKTLGYPQFSYWEFFTAPDAAEVVDKNLERMWQVLHGDIDDWMKKMFCVPNAMRSFLLGNEEVPLKAFAKRREWKEAFFGQFKRDGFGSALQMYKATVDNIQTTSDSHLLGNSLVISVPLLFILCTKDAVCVPGMMKFAKENGLVPDLTEVILECAHWSPMEMPDEIALHIKNFLVDRY